MDVKKYLIEILDYYKYKVENDLCNLEEMDSVIRSLEENAKVTGTISDFARFFNVPETTVRTNIFRKMFSKPKRKVLYSFSEFLKIVPAKWRNNK